MSGVSHICLGDGGEGEREACPLDSSPQEEMKVGVGEF